MSRKRPRENDSLNLSQKGPDSKKVVPIIDEDNLNNLRIKTISFIKRFDTNYDPNLRKDSEECTNICCNGITEYDVEFLTDIIALHYGKSYQYDIKCKTNSYKKKIVCLNPKHYSLEGPKKNSLVELDEPYQIESIIEKLGEIGDQILRTRAFKGLDDEKTLISDLFKSIHVPMGRSIFTKDSQIKEKIGLIESKAKSKADKKVKIDTGTIEKLLEIIGFEMSSKIFEPSSTCIEIKAVKFVDVEPLLDLIAVIFHGKNFKSKNFDIDQFCINKYAYKENITHTQSICLNPKHLKPITRDSKLKYDKWEKINYEDYILKNMYSGFSKDGKMQAIIQTVIFSDLINILNVHWDKFSPKKIRPGIVKEFLKLFFATSCGINYSKYLDNVSKEIGALTKEKKNNILNLLNIFDQEFEMQQKFIEYFTFKYERHLICKCTEDKEEIENLFLSLNWEKKFPIQKMINEILLHAKKCNNCDKNADINLIKVPKFLIIQVENIMEAKEAIKFENFQKFKILQHTYYFNSCVMEHKEKKYVGCYLPSLEKFVFHSQQVEIMKDSFPLIPSILIYSSQEPKGFKKQEIIPHFNMWLQELEKLDNQNMDDLNKSMNDMSFQEEDIDLFRKSQNNSFLPKSSTFNNIVKDQKCSLLIEDDEDEEMDYKIHPSAFERPRTSNISLAKMSVEKKPIKKVAPKKPVKPKEQTTDEGTDYEKDFKIAARRASNISIGQTSIASTSSKMSVEKKPIKKAASKKPVIAKEFEEQKTGMMTIKCKLNTVIRGASEKPNNIELQYLKDKNKKSMQIKLKNKLSLRKNLEEIEILNQCQFIEGKIKSKPLSLKDFQDKKGKIRIDLFLNMIKMLIKESCDQYSELLKKDVFENLNWQDIIRKCENYFIAKYNKYEQLKLADLITNSDNLEKTVYRTVEQKVYISTRNLIKNQIKKEQNEKKEKKYISGVKFKLESSDKTKFQQRLEIIKKEIDKVKQRNGKSIQNKLESISETLKINKLKDIIIDTDDEDEKKRAETIKKGINLICSQMYKARILAHFLINMLYCSELEKREKREKDKLEFLPYPSENFFRDVFKLVTNVSKKYTDNSNSIIKKKMEKIVDSNKDVFNDKTKAYRDRSSYVIDSISKQMETNAETYINDLSILNRRYGKFYNYENYKEKKNDVKTSDESDEEEKFNYKNIDKLNQNTKYFSDYLKLSQKDWTFIEISKYADFYVKTLFNNTSDKAKEWIKFSKESSNIQKTVQDYYDECDQKTESTKEDKDAEKEFKFKLSTCIKGLFFDKLMHLYYKMMKVIEPEIEKIKLEKEKENAKERENLAKESEGRPNVEPKIQTFDPKNKKIKKKPTHGKLFCLMPSIGSFKAPYIPFSQTALKDILEGLGLIPRQRSDNKTSVLDEETKKKVRGSNDQVPEKLLEYFILDYKEVQLVTHRRSKIPAADQQKVKGAPKKQKNKIDWTFSSLETDGDSVSLIFKNKSKIKEKFFDNRPTLADASKIRCGVDPGAKTMAMFNFEVLDSNLLFNNIYRKKKRKKKASSRKSQERNPLEYLGRYFKNKQKVKNEDPNYILKVAFQNRDKKENTRKDRHLFLMQLSAAQYYNDIKYNESDKHCRLAKFLDKKNGSFSILDFERSIPTKKTVEYAKYLEHVRFVTKHLEIARQFAYKSSQRKWSFTRYCKKQSFFSKLANKLEHCKVGFGNVSGKLVNRLKGNRCVPIEDLKAQLLRRHVDLIEVDEFNTSKACYHCQFVEEKTEGWVMDAFKVEDPPYPLQVPENYNFRTEKKVYSKVVGCKYSCGSIMNRDVNAALIITQLIGLEDSERPETFQRHPQRQ